jgi:gamma-glutamyl hydrolase
MPQAWKSLYNDGATYFESSHADFLQAAGARLVPVNYNLSERELEAELANLNGLYIPGDTKTTMLDSKFIETTRLSLKWAESHNTDEGKHFPVIGMGYGFLAML